MPVRDVIAGNLCRCTGYGPILDAGEANPPGPADDSEVVALLRTIAPARAGRGWFAPATSDELAALLVEHPEARIVAGATDVGLWVTKGLQDLGPIIFIGDIADLQRIEEAPDAPHARRGRALFRGEGCARPPPPGSGRARPPHRRPPGPQCGHDRRQYRQRLADRRHAPRLDRARRRAGAAQGRRTPHHAARGFFPGLRQAGPRSRASSSRASASPARRPTQKSASSSSPSASTATSPLCAARSPSVWKTAMSPRPGSPSAAWPASPPAPPPARRR